MNISFLKKETRAHLQSDADRDPVRGKFAFPWVRFFLLMCLFLAPVYFVLCRLALPWIFVESPGVVSARRAVARMPFSGTVVAVAVSAKDRVQSGNTLFYIEDSLVAAKRERIELLCAQQFLLPEESEPAGGVRTRALVQAEQSLRYHRQRRNDMEELFRKRAATVTELNAARGRERAAQRDLLRLQEGSRADRDTYEQNRLAVLAERKRIGEELFELEKEITSRDVLSPLKGEVIELAATTGDVLPKGALLAVIADRQNPEIVAFAGADAFPFIEEGKIIRVTPVGGKSIPARVEALFPQWQDDERGHTTTYAEAAPVLRVRLRPLAPLPENLMNEGFPVTVRWAVRLPDVLKSYLLKEDE